MLAWACIAPHGGEIIPELADGNLHRMVKTRGAMEELGRRCLAALPETIVVYTPHGVSVEGLITVSVGVAANGSLDGPDGRSVSAGFDVDIDLARRMSREAADAGVPVGEAAYLPDGAPMPVFPMDFGVLVPMWYMGASWRTPPRIVIACPDRSLPRRELLAFGRATVGAARALGRRIAIVCSADQGHGHSADGPYGFSATSQRYDLSYCRAVREDALARLLNWGNAWIESALPDSFWQTVMLHGALLESPLRPELLSYEAPTYFGMACASFEP